MFKLTTVVSGNHLTTKILEVVKWMPPFQIYPRFEKPNTAAVFKRIRTRPECFTDPKTGIIPDHERHMKNVTFWETFNNTFKIFRCDNEPFFRLPFKFWNPGTLKWILANITLEKKLAHGGHPVLRWMMDNIFIQQIRRGISNQIRRSLFTLYKKKVIIISK